MQRILCTAVLLCVSLAPIAHAADSPVRIPPRDQILGTLQPEHPRLLVAPDDFTALKARIAANPRLAEWYADVQRQADESLKRPANTYRIPDGKRLLSTSRSVLGRVYQWALVYCLENDRRYLDRVWKELQAAAAFKDWNPSHFLDTGEMTHAFAIGYDWLYHDWSDEQRKTIRQAIIQHGLVPGLKSYRGEERYGWFTRTVSNWNQVCNGGMTAGALAIADEEPEMAAEIIHSALQSVPLAMHEYAPDGAYHEGPGYWGYGTSYNVLMIALLESALGSDFGLTEFEGFDNTVRFPMQMTGPTGRVFNFADASAGRPGRTFAMLWLANRFKHADVIRFTEPFVRPTALDLLWYDPQSRSGGSETPDVATYWRGVEAVSLRTKWNDPNASWIAFKGDVPGVNHGQADLGTFVLEMVGERWALDLGADNYNLPGYFDRRTRRWHFYRNRAEGHNTLVINPDDGPDQATDGKAKVIHFDPKAATPAAFMDLTPAYTKHATRVHRAIALVDGNLPAVQDEVELEKPSDVWWFMHTPANVSVNSNGRQATLTLGDKRIVAHLVEPDDATFTVMDAAPLPSSPTVKGQRVNKGVRKLVIHLEDIKSTSIVVAFTPEGTAPPAHVRSLGRQ